MCFSTILTKSVIFDALLSSIKVAIPDEPSAAMQTIADEVIAGNYSIIWHAMPTSYQTDINAIARLAGSKVDPYQQALSMKV